MSSGRMNHPSEALLDDVWRRIREREAAIRSIEAELRQLEQEKQSAWAQVMQARAATNL